MPIYEPMVIKARGGALPQYTRDSQNYVPGAGVSARVDSSAAHISAAGSDAEARALAGLGRSIRGAAEVGIRAYDEYSKSKAIQALTEYRREMNTALWGENGILTQQGEAAFNVDQQRAERARKARDRALKDAGERTKYYFGLQADEYDADTSLKAQRYAQDQRTKWELRTSEAAAQERAEFAMDHYGNENDFTKGTGEALFHVERGLKLQGYSGEALQRGIKEASSKIFRGSIERALANGDIQGAQRLLGRGGAKREDGTALHMTLGDVSWAEGAIRSKREAMQAKAEAAAKKAAQVKQKQLVQTMADTFMDQVKDYPEDEQKGALATLCESIEDEDLRKQVLNAGSSRISFEKLKSDAAANRQVREFQAYAKSQGWSPAQAQENILNATNISDKAKDKLEKIFGGMREKKTRENRAAQQELLVLIDKGVENGGIDKGDKDAIEAFAFNRGLTTTQTEAALKYAESGGAKGALTISMANTAAKMLYPTDTDKAKKLVEDYFDLVQEYIEPGKKVTAQQVRSIFAMLATEGQNTNAFGFGLGRDMTYGEAAKRGDQDAFMADVPEEDAQRITELLEAKGITVTPKRISEYYISEQRSSKR